MSSLSAKILSLISIRILPVLTALFIGSSGVASADTTAALPNLRNVMSGQSSSGTDQVWIRVDGQPAGVPTECTYSGYSLFYVPANSTQLAPDKALSIALSAKLANQPVQIAFTVETAKSDFWGWGWTYCRLTSIVIGN